ncbi:MAG: pitrilysin family protein, partial [Victivallales bacterium]|nr:pitrilysin family protein [Victivallales bacterium]
LELLRGVLINPRFDRLEFIRERKNLVEKLGSRASSPQGMAEDRLLQLLYGDHPYAIPRYGMAGSLKKLRLPALRDFYFHTCLRAEAVVCGMAGDFNSRTIRSVEALLAAVPWTTAAVPPKVAPPVFPTVPVREQLVNHRSQTVVMAAVPACDNLSPDRYMIDILQSAMNGQGSRLFRKIREEAGLAYYTGMFSSRGFHPGYISIFAGTSREGAAETAKLIEEERQRLAQTGLDPDEFEAAIAALSHAHAEQLENSGSLLMQSCLSEYYGNGVMEPFRQQEIFDRITRTEANAVIRRYLSHPNQVCLVCRPENAPE